MQNLLGVMQGRLLPKYEGRYQAHPVGYWHQEFELAKSLGFGAIEFIFDSDKWADNPLVTEAGLNAIERLVSETGVQVKTVCADFFMEHPFYVTGQRLEFIEEVFGKLLDGCDYLGVTDIVIPCVDQSSLRDPEKIRTFIANISKFTSIIERKGINLALETDLDPNAFLNLLNSLPSRRFSVNYDSGNSASLGFNVVEEFEAYGDRITDVHIKDRIYAGGSVVLGQGAVDFDSFFEMLKKYAFDGPLIMQAYRDEDGWVITKDQFEWIRDGFLLN